MVTPTPTSTTPTSDPVTVPGVVLDPTPSPVGTRVKVHPHKTKVNSGLERCVSVTPDMPGGRAFYEAVVELTDARFRIHRSGVERARREQVRNVHAWCVGTLASSSPVLTQVDTAGLTQVTYHFNIGRFVTLDGGVDVTDLTFERAVCRGRDFFVALPSDGEDA